MFGNDHYMKNSMTYTSKNLDLICSLRQEREKLGNRTCFGHSKVEYLFSS